MKLRPVVQEFAEQMEMKLRTHDETRGKRGWVDAEVAYLFHRLLEEVDELRQARITFEHGGPSFPLMREAVDVANLAMMVADAALTQRIGSDRLTPYAMASPDRKGMAEKMFEELVGMWHTGQFDGERVTPDCRPLHEICGLTEGEYEVMMKGRRDADPTDDS